MFINVVLVLTPIMGPLVISSWPAISAAVAGAAVALGLVAKTTAREELQAAGRNVQVKNSAEVEVSNGEIAKDLVAVEEIVLAKGEIEVRVKRDARGRFTVCASGRGRTKEELKAFAEEFTQKMTQCFVYNRVMTELKARGFQVLSEERMKDDTLNIHVRRWEG